MPNTSPLPYSISRTTTSNLPIYESTKSGGSKHITTIRKIRGSLTDLALSVREALGLKEFVTDFRGRRKANVLVNGITRQVVVRGWRAAEIRVWAERNGF
jgi:hypothetical protein